MRVVSAQARTPSANAAVWAMVDLLPRVIVPELADAAVVARRLYAALGARVGCRLRGATGHAQHVLRRLAVQGVVLDVIVAVSTRVPTATVVALHLDIAPVVLTAQHELIAMLVLVVLVVCMVEGAVGWACVGWAQLVRIARVDVRGRRGRRRGAVVGEARVL